MAPQPSPRDRVSSSPSAEQEYEERLAARKAAVAALERSDHLCGQARFVCALCAVALGLAAWRSATLSSLWALAPVAVFLMLAVRELLLGRALRRARRGVAFYEHGLARLQDRWQGMGESGAAFADERHLYAPDLDLFGTGSVFQLLCQARTREGQARLATWLGAGAAAGEVAARQAAVRELGPALDLRERLASEGAEVAREAVDPAALCVWAGAPALSWTAGKRARLRLMGACLAGAFLVIAPAALSGKLGPEYLLGLLVVDAFAMRLFRPVMERIGTRVDLRLDELKVLGGVLAHLETATFSSPRLRDLVARLRDDAGALPPSRRLQQLERLVSWFEQRRNQMLIPLLWPTFWGPQWALSIEAWRARHGATVLRWLDAVADIEALASLAAFAHERPDYAFPHVREDGPVFAGLAVGHPMIPARDRVANDVALGSPPHGAPGPHLLVVSGSNMSGKSTFLRTVGVNTVLAMAGAPVCARALTVSPVRLGATLRINDSLAEGKSRFFAEISRIRQVVALADEPAPAWPLLFLFDEILAGTNSEDRLVGARGILAGLLAKPTMGLVTTHDLALTRTVEGLGGAAANVHFQDHLENGQMRFDYKMRPGVVTKSNALELMRAVGLSV
jgi:hypothetical protein